MRSEYKERSRDLIEAGYFLSRFTEFGVGRLSLPPRELGVNSWSVAYDLFHPKLSGGRPIVQFRNTLKNCRDEFDGYFENGRQGWKESDGRPQRLNQKPHEVFEEFGDQNRKWIWERIQNYLSDELSNPRLERYC